MKWVTDGPVDYPPLEQADEARREAEVKDAFFQEHWQELLQKYPDQFVAVLDGEVIAHCSDLLEFEDLVESKGLKLTDVWFKYVETGSRIMLL